MESLCCLIQYASEALVLAHFGHKATYAILILLAASMNIIDEIHLLPTAVRLQLIRIFELVLERYGYLFSHSFITKARQLHEKLMEGYPPAARRSAKDGVSTGNDKCAKHCELEISGSIFANQIQVKNSLISHSDERGKEGVDIVELPGELKSSKASGKNKAWIGEKAQTSTGDRSEGRMERILFQLAWTVFDAVGKISSIDMASVKDLVLFDKKECIKQGLTDCLLVSPVLYLYKAGRVKSRYYLKQENILIWSDLFNRVVPDVEKWQKFLSITTNTNSLFQHLGENCCWRWLRVTDRSHKRLIDVSKFVKFILKFQLEFDFESIVAICIMCWKHQHMKSLNNAAKPKKNSETGRTCVSSITIKSRSKQEDSISTAHGKCTYLEQRKKKAVRAMLDSIITEEAVEVIGAKMEKDPVFLASLQGKINGNGLFNESRTMICGDYVGPLLKKHACISMIVQYLTKTIITPGRTGEKNSEFEILIKAESRQNIGKAVGLIRLMNSGNIQFNNFCSILMDIFLNDGGRYLAVNYHRQSYAEAAFQSAPLQQPSQQMN